MDNSSQPCVTQFGDFNQELTGLIVEMKTKDKQKLYKISLNS